MVESDLVKPGAVVTRCGCRVEDLHVIEVRVVGDVHPDVGEIASMFSPVPGGVGPMTVAVDVNRLLPAEIGIIEMVNLMANS